MTEPADAATTEAVRDAQAAVTEMWAASIGTDIPLAFMLPLVNLTDALARIAHEVNVQSVPGAKEAKVASDLWSQSARTAAIRRFD